MTNTERKASRRELERDQISVTYSEECSVVEVEAAAEEVDSKRERSSLSSM